ncbi:MAG: hypothetical protein NTZ33_05480 [Bacteroidetes bacterium]|nr:hypothetical protein [Bacteroidota bacterium]
MRKILLFVLFLAFIGITAIQAQENNAPYRPKPDDWGTFCLVSSTVGDTNYFKLDLNQIATEFEKIYLKYYYIEQDVFHTNIKEYSIENGTAMIAVPKRYAIEDYRHFMAMMKKMAFTANYNFTNEEKAAYLENHKKK